MKLVYTKIIGLSNYFSQIMYSYIFESEFIFLTISLIFSKSIKERLAISISFSSLYNSLKHTAIPNSFSSFSLNLHTAGLKVLNDFFSSFKLLEFYISSKETISSINLLFTK